MSAEAELVKEIIDRGYWDTIFIKCFENCYVDALETILRGANEIGLNENCIKEVEAAIKICKGI